MNSSFRVLWVFWVVFCGLLSACSSDDNPSSESTASKSGRFDALTYNVAGLPQGLSGSEPELYMPLISPLLNGYDLVLVQEDFAYHDELSQDVEHPYRSIPKEHHVTLVDDGLNRFSEFPFEPVTRHQWVACYGDATTGASDCLAEKGFSVAPTVFDEQAVFHVYNLHVEAGGGPEDISAREAGIDQLIAHVQEHSAGEVILMGGDFNLHENDPLDAALLTRLAEETGLQDVCTFLNCGDSLIDRFYFRSSDQIELLPTEWATADEFVDPQGNDLSDHRAVRATFEWQIR